jgi:hypothetical protein
MSSIKKYSLIVFAFSPAFALAADITDLKSLITYAIQIMNALIPLFFAMAFLGFIWGVIKYLYAAGPQKLSEARNYIIFGILAMAVMLSVWGLALLVKNSFFESAQTPVDVNIGGGKDLLNQPFNPTD